MRRIIGLLAVLLLTGQPAQAQLRLGASIYVSATAPTDVLLEEGHLWYDTSTNTLKVVTGLNPTTWGALGAGEGGPETDPIFAASEAASFVAGDKTKLDGIAASATVGADWLVNLANIPATFTPSSHSHAEADVTNLTTDLAAKAPTPLSCNATTEKLRWTGAAWECVTDQTGAGGGLPAGASVLLLSGSCAATLGAGWAEAAIGGKFLLVTTDAAGDIGGTGGSDSITDVINHTHPVNVTDNGHGHLLQRYPTTTGGSSGFTADTSMSGTPTDTTLSTKSGTTGISATTSNPAGGAASIDNRPAFVRVIVCVKQ